MCTVGVQRQYTGTAGRIENAQVAVYLTYAGARRHAMIDRELYLPRSWADDDQRCAEAGVPAGIEFLTKPALAAGMICRALDAGVPARWVAGDEVYGADPALRGELEIRRVGYVLAIGCDRRVPTAFGLIRADTLTARLPKRAWQRLSAGAGAKGRRYYDWALVALLPPVESAGDGGDTQCWWLLVRRHRGTGELAFYRCYSPEPMTIYGWSTSAVTPVAFTAGETDRFESRRSGVVLPVDVRCWLAVTVFRTLPLAVVLLVAACTTPADDHFVGIEQVRVASGGGAPGPDASTGVFRKSCGRNAERHLNADNAVISPGLRNGAHHTHEYVGNLSTDAFSTPESLVAAPSTCTDGDLSAYFWPVLRLTDVVGHDAHEEGGGVHGNTGEVLAPDSVSIAFTGSPVSKVVPLPRFLRTITGNPSAATSGGLNANAKWGCTGFDERFTMKYPRCPAGSAVSRTFDFPRCWDGRNVDSASHRDHVVPASADGACPPATFPVPRLRLVVTYAVPAGRPFAVDSFPDERRDPITDHAMFVNVFPDALMAEVAACLNDGRACG